MIKVEFKHKNKIQREALEWIEKYNPKYLNDLDQKIDYYDFLFNYLPEAVNNIPGEESLSVSYFDKPMIEDGNRIAGYTTQNEVKIDSTLFNSDIDTEYRMTNWAIVHESYHAIFHRQLLRAKTQQQELFSIGVDSNKLDRIVTLHRDVGIDKSMKTPAECIQANIFAGYFMIPKQRLKIALQKVSNNEEIFVPKGFQKESWIDLLLADLIPYFDVNKMPLKIAINSYGFFEEKNALM